MVNEKGGIKGKKIELVKADAPDPTTATTEAGRLIEQQGIKLIFGSMSSGNALAISSVTEKSGAILVESGGITDELTNKGFKYVFRVIDKGSYRGALGVRYSSEVLAPIIGKKPSELRVAIINEESSYGASVGGGAEAEAKKLGLNIVLHESYNAKITDMSAMVLKIKAAAPDVLLSVNYINDAILLFDTLKQYKAMPKIFMGCGAGTTDPNFAKTIGTDSDGVFCMDMPTNLPIQAFSKDEKVKIAVQEFRTRFLKAYPSVNAVPVGAECAFCGAYSFLNDILPRAASTEIADIRTAALATKLSLTTLGFGLDFGEDGQNKSATANIGQWQNGKVVTVYPSSLKNGEQINVPLPIASK